MPPRKRSGDDAAGDAAGKAARGAGGSGAPQKPQIFTGVSVLACGLQGETVLKGLVLSHGGAFFTAYSPGQPVATHVVVENTERLTPARAARVKAQHARNTDALCVTRAWLSECFKRGLRLPESDFLAEVAAPTAAAAAKAQHEEEELAAARRLREDTPDDPDDAPPPAQDAFVPPPPSGEACSACGQSLPWCSILTCQACLKAAGGGNEALTRALHLRFRLDHPNKALVAALTELSEYEALFGDVKSADTFRRQAAMLKATPRDIVCVADIATFDPPYVGTKARERYIPSFLATGVLERLERFKRDPTKVAERNILRLPYIGTKLAKAWAAHGCVRARRQRGCCARRPWRRGPGGAAVIMRALVGGYTIAHRRPSRGASLYSFALNVHNSR
jgi:hypothetical protein